MAPALFLILTLANDVKDMVARNDLAAAEKAVAASRKQAGSTPEFAAALSWLARGAFNAHQLDHAEAYAVQTRQLSDQLLRTHKLDADPWLPTAVGAAIEIHAQVLAARGEGGEAVGFLREQLALFGNSSLHERIQKNLNLLNLEGKPAPALESGEWLGTKPPDLASLRGHPVLLFFWAHWCSDCKAEVSIVAEMRKIYGPKGLLVIAPTKYYGYVAQGENAGPGVEKPYIESVRRKYYAALSDVPAPLSNANFLKYGASTVPTLVLIDTAGVVRMFHPGKLDGAELAARIQKILKK
jgi:cytochrome c biogenesis protein CcmG, thiol:disulfide interchange protein DsbE